MNLLLINGIYIPFLFKRVNSLPKIWYQMKIHEHKYDMNYATEIASVLKIAEHLETRPIS